MHHAHAHPTLPWDGKRIAAIFILVSDPAQTLSLGQLWRFGIDPCVASNLTQSLKEKLLCKVYTYILLELALLLEKINTPVDLPFPQVDRVGSCPIRDEDFRSSHWRRF